MMKWRLLLSLFFLGVLVFALCPVSHESVAEKAINLPAPQRKLASISGPHRKVTFVKDELIDSGLSQEKVQAIYGLRDFHGGRPTFNQENILKRNLMLEELERNPRETVESFVKLMRESQDDGLKTFLLNLAMNTNMLDEEKAEIFTARILSGAHFSREGIVPDEELSIMISLSHLSRLEDAHIKTEAIEKLKSHEELLKDTGFQKAFMDYFGQAL